MANTRLAFCTEKITDDTWLGTTVSHWGLYSVMTCSLSCLCMTGPSCLPTRKCLVASCVAFFVLGAVAIVIAVGITFGIPMRSASMCQHTHMYLHCMFAHWVDLLMGSGWYVLRASSHFAHSCNVPVRTVMTDTRGEGTACPLKFM